MTTIDQLCIITRRLTGLRRVFVIAALLAAGGLGHAESQSPDALVPAPQAAEREGGAGLPQGDAEPKTAEDRGKALDQLYGRLAKTRDEAEGTTIRASIRQLWLNSGSATIDLLLERDAQAALGHDPALRHQLLDAASKLSPETAEIWNRRAGLDYGELHFAAAMADLARVLAIDPRHFEAIEALATILRETGREPLALRAFRRLQAVNPTAPNLQKDIDDLTRKVEGQKI